MAVTNWKLQFLQELQGEEDGLRHLDAGKRCDP